MRLEREVTRVEERHRRVGIVAFERLRSRRQEERIVLAPDRQEWRLVGAEILLESRVERDVALIVAEKVELNLVGAGPCQVEVVEVLPVRRNGRFIGDAVSILPARGLRGQEGPQRSEEHTSELQSLMRNSY